MCNWLSLEICCCQDEHPLPHTLQVCNCMALCDPVARDYKLDVAVNGEAAHPPEHFGSRCRDYDKKYIRFERIFWSTCNACTVKIASKVAGSDEDDALMYQEFQRLLRVELANAIQTRQYKDLVRTFPTEFSIHERFLLKGSRWVKAPEPTDEDALGPNPAYDKKLDGLIWWLEQGFGGKVHNELWRNFCGSNYPADPMGLGIRSWVVSLPPERRPYAPFGARSMSSLPSTTSFEPRRYFAPAEGFSRHRSRQEYIESYDPYPINTDDEDSDMT
ncbi:hypothetical protein F4776DRAFT_676579 [Hypoxylon sp. NC0597]|nr:hypothetical protein F4776DRAFT_676579 [Hypoxylon sp. NC0597]